VTCGLFAFWERITKNATHRPNANASANAAHAFHAGRTTISFSSDIVTSLVLMA
jgi:hypothetical protein